MSGTDYKLDCDASGEIAPSGPPITQVYEMFDLNVDIKLRNHREVTRVTLPADPETLPHYSTRKMTDAEFDSIPEDVETIILIDDGYRSMDVNKVQKQTSAGVSTPGEFNDERIEIVPSTKFERAAGLALCQTGGIQLNEVEQREMHGLGGLTFRSLADECLRRENKTPATLSGVDRFSAAMSTVSFPEALGEAVNRALLAGYADAEKTLLKICGVKTVKDFREAHLIKVSRLSRAEVVGKGGKFPHANFGESAETHQAVTMGEIYTISRQDFINDDIGLFDALKAAMGESVADAVEDLVVSILTSNSGVGPVMAEDNRNLFSALHANINYFQGAETALSASALRAGLSAFRTRKNGLQLLNMPPAFILVPAALEWTMEELLGSREKREGGGESSTENQPTSNPLFGRIAQDNRLVSAKLDDYSAKAWYLGADPKRNPSIVLSYLNGKQDPYAMRIQAVDPLAYSFLIYHDVGVDAIDYLPLQKYTGEAEA